MLSLDYKNKKFENWFLVVPLVGVVSLLLYFWKFNDGYSDEQAVWGAFGDYIGGILNPVISLCTLIIALMVFKLQKEELSETKQALSSSAETALLQAKIDIETSLLQISISKKESIENDIQRLAGTDFTYGSGFSRTFALDGSILSQQKQIVETIDKQTKQLKDVIKDIEMHESEILSLYKLLGNINTKEVA